MIDMIAKLIKVLNSETEPGQISLAVCFAMIMGFTPLWSIHNAIVLLLVLIIRLNLSTFLLAWGVFSAIAYLLDPLFHRIGLSVLTAESLNGTWTVLYNNIWFRLDGFNNSVAMGSLVFSLVLFIPVFLVLNMVIRRYREHILTWVKKTRIVQMLETSKLYQAYQTVSGWGGRS
ncbi:MAG: TIGR03546 family protein [Desulfobacteraceae bacterium]|nr:TIGR03546 family protein [Desulfobacteraceae bacterium]